MKRIEEILSGMDLSYPEKVAILAAVDFMSGLPLGSPLTEEVVNWYGTITMEGFATLNSVSRPSLGVEGVEYHKKLEEWIARGKSRTPRGRPPVKDSGVINPDH